MTVPQEEPIRLAGIPIGDAVDVLRSEPALAWFLAQGLWLAQPVLEIFWPQEQIAQIAEILESPRQSGAAPRPAGEEPEGQTGS